MKKKKVMVMGFALIAVVLMILAITGFIEESLGVTIAIGMTIIFTIIVGIMAYKSDVKILTWLMALFTLIGLVLLAVNVARLLREPKEKKSDFSVKTYVDNTLEKKELFSHKDKKYYTYKLSKVEVVKDGNTRSLKDSLEGNYVTLDDILSEMIPNENTKGYKIYYDGGSAGSNDKFSVVVCEGSKDVVFAPYDYTYEASICDNSNDED